MVLTTEQAPTLLLTYKPFCLRRFSSVTTKLLGVFIYYCHVAPILVTYRWTRYYGLKVDQPSIDLYTAFVLVLAPRVRLELTTLRLTAARSTD